MVGEFYETRRGDSFGAAAFPRSLSKLQLVAGWVVSEQAENRDVPPQGRYEERQTSVPVIAGANHALRLS